MQKGARIVVVEYDGAEVLSRCLSSLSTTVPGHIPITIIDNASPADVMSLIPDTNRDRFDVVKMKVNAGYAGAIAKAWEIGDEEYLIIANNDLEFTPGWFESLIKTADETGAYAVSAVIRHENECEIEKSTNASLNPLLYLMPGVFTDRTKAVYPSGACFLLRRDGSIPCPIVDKDYFLYYEDVYIGFLLRAFGKDVVQCPDAVVKHIGSHSVKKSNPNRISFIQERNRLLTMCLFYNYRILIFLLPYFLLGVVLRPFSCLARKKPFWATACAHLWIPAHGVYIWKKHAALRKFPDFDETRIYPYLTSKVVPDSFPGAKFHNGVARWWFRLIGIAVDKEAEV
jgi:GT2 family glycosyltransferase